MVLGVSWLFGNFPGRFLKVIGAVGITVGAGIAIKPFAFRFMCDRAFDKIDHDKNNFLDAVELQLCIYELYNLLNKRFPGWSDPPERPEILAAIKEFDVDGNMKLDKDEFHEFAKKFVAGGSSFFARFGKDTSLNTVMMPAVAPVAKKLVGLGAIPDVMAVPLMSQAGKILKALNPTSISTPNPLTAVKK